MLRNLNIGELDNPIVKVHVLALDLSLNNKFEEINIYKYFQKNLTCLGYFYIRLTIKLRCLSKLHDGTNDLKKKLILH